MGCVLFISIVQFSRINSASLQRKSSYQIFSFPSSTFLSTFRFQFVAFVSATSISYQMISIWSSTFLSTFFWSVAVVSATKDSISKQPRIVKYFIKYNPCIFSIHLFTIINRKKLILFDNKQNNKKPDIRLVFLYYINISAFSAIEKAAK